MMGQELGPFTLAQLRSQLDAGELAPQAKVRRGKTGNWSPLSSHLTGPGAATPTGSTRAPAAQVAPAPIAPAPIAPAPIAPPAAWAAPAPVVVAAPVIVPVVAAPIAAPPGNVSGSSAASSAVDEDRIWYCYTNDKQYGPISLETLAKWAAEGRLKKDNHVKMGADGEWFRAGDTDELFNEDKKAAKQGMAEVRIQSTAEFAQEKSNMQTAAVPAAAATNPNQQQKFTPLVAKDFKRTNRHDKKPGLNIPKQYIYLGVLVAVGLAVYLPQLPFVKSIFGGSWDQKVLLTLRNHYINLKKFREKKDAAGWDKYAKSVEKEMKSLATTLNSRGGSAYPARQQMMYAARDHWPKMVTDSKEKAGESEEKFNKALSAASTAMRKKK